MRTHTYGRATLISLALASLVSAACYVVPAAPPPEPSGGPRVVDRRYGGEMPPPLPPPPPGNPQPGVEQPLPPPASEPFRLEPTAGPVGTTVAIYGSFSAAAGTQLTISFAGVAPLRPVQVSDGRVLAVVPQGARSGPLQVTMGGSVVFAQQFTVTATDDGLLIPTGEDRGLLGEVYALPVNTRRLPDFRLLGQPVATIVVPSLQVKPRSFDTGFPGLGAAGQTLLEWFAIRFTGFIDIPSAGEYRFRLNSDDGSRLYIDNQLIIDNDGVHPPKAMQGAIRLSPGKHQIVVEYFQGPRNQIALELAWSTGATWVPVPDTALSRSKDAQPSANYCTQQPQPALCCKALTPECQDCERRSRETVEAWQRQCTGIVPPPAAPAPVVNCSQPPAGRACCKALTPACQECARQVTEERQQWEAQCGRR